MRLEKLKEKIEMNHMNPRLSFMGAEGARSLAGGLHRVIVLGWAVFSCHSFSCTHFCELCCQVGEVNLGFCLGVLAWAVF